MQLQYEGANPEYFNIELRLASEPTLKISIFGESARQQALGMSAELEQVLSPYKNKHYLWHPNLKVTVFLVATGGLSAGILMGISFVRTISKKLGIPMPDNATVSIVTLAVPMLLTIIIAYFCGRVFYPYMAFDTKKNQTRQAVAKWVFLGFVGFMLFTVGGVYFRQQLFGF